MWCRVFVANRVALFVQLQVQAEAYTEGILGPHVAEGSTAIAIEVQGEASESTGGLQLPRTTLPKRIPNQHLMSRRPSPKKHMIQLERCEDVSSHL